MTHNIPHPEGGEHPLIPDEAWNKARAMVRGHYGGTVDLDAVSDLAVATAAKVLWSEWTRGMAVVPLPEPDEEISMGARFHETIGQFIVDEPQVIHQGLVMSPSEARARAVRLLAAADRAEQLAADAKAAQS